MHLKGKILRILKILANPDSDINTKIMEKLILSSKKLQGSLILVYENGVLKSFSNEFKKPLNAVQEAEIKRVLQFNFSNVNTLDYASICFLGWTKWQPTSDMRNWN